MPVQLKNASASLEKDTVTGGGIISRANWKLWEKKEQANYQEESNNNG